MPVLHQAVGGDEIRSAVQTILASDTFTRSQQLSRLLRYLCNCLIEHGADRIAEYSIGTEALGRPLDFDPAQDAAVRVEMHRLRRRLRDYYNSEGARDAVRIVIPPGRYAPVVTWVEEEQSDNSASPALAPEVDSVMTREPAEPPAPVEIAPVVLPPSAIPPERRPAPRFRQRGWIIAAVSVGALGIALAATTLWRGPLHSANVAHVEAAKIVAPVPLPSPLLGYRIGCGRRRPWTDRLGQVWGHDEYFEGGNAVEIPPRSYIAGAFDARLFESARGGSFTYRIPLPARTYEMRLYFMEPTFGPDTDSGGEANRLFSVAVNGRNLLDRFDILADADGPWTADVRVFKDISPGPDGYVRLDFKSITNASLVNAIEFVPARPNILNPLRMLPQDNFYTDSAGNLWTPDNYSKGGRVGIHPGPVRNTRDQEIFRHERFGHFRYSIPADQGLYSLYVYMAEEYWGLGNPGGGGAGSRVFSIFCNGAALVRGIDLIKEAGTNYGVVRAFHHLTPNAQGKLVISFEPEHDYASFYGLEIIDEAGPDSSSAERIVTGAAPGILR